MEILVTIIAFWLILVGAYGAYSLSQERSRERPPRVRARPQAQANLTPAAAGNMGPFGPVSLPVERVPSFITRTSTILSEPESYDDFEDRMIDAVEEEDVPDRFRAERIVAARLGRTEPSIEEDLPSETPEKPRYDEAAQAASNYQEPAPEVEAQPEPERRRPVRRTEPARLAKFELPARPAPTEVDFLRAEVQHLRSEINALSSEVPRKLDRPKQRRYRTGVYTHLPRTLRRQVNEARGRFFSN